MNIEESIQQIETLIEAWRLDEADLNQTDINAMQALLKENQELKSQLKGTTHCFDEEEHEELKKQLEVGKEQYNDLVEEKEELQEQLSSNTLQLEKLKKQVEQYQEEVCILDMRTDENIKYKNQQKEFINYLEDEIYSIEPKGTGINYNCEYDSEADYVMAMQEQSRLNTLKEILQKYKEIIGDDK